MRGGARCGEKKSVKYGDVCSCGPGWDLRANDQQGGYKHNPRKTRAQVSSSSHVLLEEPSGLSGSSEDLHGDSWWPTDSPNYNL